MITLPQIHDPPPQGGCGSCLVCCDVEGVPALGKPYYARCPHLRTESTTGGCGIYEHRPEECGRYRCAWHLGWLGGKVDRRPDQNGLLVTIRPEGQRWSIDVLETRPGAATVERVRDLARIILTSKKTRHLSFTDTVRLIPYGADLSVTFAISRRYKFDPPSPNEPVKIRREAGMIIYDGHIRGLLMPGGDAGTSTTARAS